MSKTNPEPFVALQKKYAKMYKHLNKLVDEWMKDLGLEHWSITTDYVTSGHDFAAAQIQPQWEYQSAHLKFFMPNISTCGPRELEYALIHELCHCLVNPMSRPHNKWTKREEIVVTKLSKAFISLKYKNKDKNEKVSNNRKSIPVLPSTSVPLSIDEDCASSSRGDS